MGGVELSAFAPNHCATLPNKASLPVYLLLKRGKLCRVFFKVWFWGWLFNLVFGIVFTVFACVITTSETIDSHAVGPPWPRSTKLLYCIDPAAKHWRKATRNNKSGESKYFSNCTKILICNPWKLVSIFKEDDNLFFCKEKLACNCTILHYSNAN